MRIRGEGGTFPNLYKLVRVYVCAAALLVDRARSQNLGLNQNQGEVPKQAFDGMP